jgi:hypothetical protein
MEATNIHGSGKVKTSDGADGAGAAADDKDTDGADPGRDHGRTLLQDYGRTLLHFSPQIEPQLSLESPNGFHKTCSL